jgi:hypothetical protein
VANDARGFRGAWCHIYHGISDPLSVETLAFRDVLAFAKQHGYVRITSELDCAKFVSCGREGRTNFFNSSDVK